MRWQSPRTHFLQSLLWAWPSVWLLQATSLEFYLGSPTSIYPRQHKSIQRAWNWTMTTGSPPHKSHLTHAVPPFSVRAASMRGREEWAFRDKDMADCIIHQQGKEWTPLKSWRLWSSPCVPGLPPEPTLRLVSMWTGNWSPKPEISHGGIASTLSFRWTNKKFWSYRI